MEQPLRGTSLIEFLVSMLVGLLLVSAALSITMARAKNFRTDKARLNAEARLSLVAAEMNNQLANLETSFWETFPQVIAPIHAIDHQHGPLQITKKCPFGPSTCLIAWDLEPATSPIWYRVEDHDHPDWISLTPEDPSNPVGPAAEIDSGSVLLFTGESGSFCVLVSETAGNRVSLASRKVSPWAMPEELSHATEFSVFHLGILRLDHFSLAPASSGKKLVVRPWKFENNHWLGKRSRSSFDHLHQFVWFPCNSKQPDQLAIVAAPQPLRFTNEPTWIGLERFQEEVIYAMLRF